MQQDKNILIKQAINKSKEAFSSAEENFKIIVTRPAKIVCIMQYFTLLAH